MHACACAYVGGELGQTRVHAVLDLPSVYVCACVCMRVNMLEGNSDRHRCMRYWTCPVCMCVCVCMHACACAIVGGELGQTRVHAVLDLPSVYV